MNVTMADLMHDPGKFGLPTFDQYCANPDTYRKSFKRLMTEIEIGPQSYRNITKEIVHWVGINKCKTPERAMDIMLDMGWNPIHVDSRIDMETGSAGKLIFNVHWLNMAPKEAGNDEIFRLESQEGS